MSARATNWAWQQGGMGAGAKIVLLALAEYADRQDGTCFPSRKTLAAECEMSPATVTRALATLAELDMVKVDERRREDGRLTSNLYTLTVAQNEPRSGEQFEPRSMAQIEQGIKDSRLTNNSNEPPLPPGGEDVMRVWNTYVLVMKPRNTTLPADERRLIHAALAVAKVEELQRAILGCSKSPFHMGHNDRGRPYNRLTHILKGKRGVRTLREQIDLFLDIAEKSGAGAGTSSAVRDRIRREKQTVQTAFNMPHSDAARQQGEASERWLAEHGIEVVREHGGARPTFRSAAEPGNGRLLDADGEGPGAADAGR